MNDKLRQLLDLRVEVETLALKVAERQGLLLDERLKTAGDFYFEKPLEFALHKCAFYACSTCDKPFFGGLIDCEQELALAERQEVKKEDIKC